MKIVHFLIMTLLSFLFVSPLICASVEFDVKQFGLLPVHGEFKHVDASYESGLIVTVNISSINTENKTRDRHLISNDFFNADDYPVIVFKSDVFSLVPTKNMLLSGQLMMMGTTTLIQIPISLTWSSNGMILDSQFSVNRIDLGLKGYKRRISEDVDIFAHLLL
jgi:polyisoprenoid-binding protein YceI